ncbi:MAG: hypothetical protein HYR88_02245 [Verrucomicrobia bacterium]|nr:hypothetical protein [Verrucomicrobiota bacterium]
MEKPIEASCRLLPALILLSVGSQSAFGLDMPATPPALRDARVEASSRQLDLGAYGAVTLTTLLPFDSHETILIKDMSGEVVRLLVDEPRLKGTFRDIWDGRDESGRRTKDGQYRWIAVLKGHEETVTIDQSGEMDGDFEIKTHPEYAGWNPFDNAPLRFHHTFERPGEVTLVFTRETYYVTPSCDPPKFFCRFLGFVPAGDFSYEWAGVDDTGARRTDLHGVMVISHHERLSKNAIVVFGGAPKVSGVTVTPAYFRTDSGEQAVSFHLHTFQRERASVTVSFTSQESLSVLRTLVSPEADPGAVSLAWDGRTARGIPVAPGNYTVSVRATDSIGQTTVGEILTAVGY